MLLGRWQRAWSWYQRQLAEKPLRTQVATSAILWATGDAVAQKVDQAAGERRRRVQGLAAVQDVAVAPVAGRSHYQTDTAHPAPSEGQAAREGMQDGGNPGPGRMDMSRICTTGLFGAAFVGPVGNYWYLWLEHFVKSTMHLRPRSTPFLVTKIALDTFIFGPVHLVAFFTWTGLVSGHSIQKIRKDVARDLIPAFLTEATVWPLIQFGNFRYVPVRHQLFVVNVFCLIDSAWLSWLKYQQDAPWKLALQKIITWPT